MSCVVCGAAGNCKACRYEGAVRRRVDAEPAFRDLIAKIWRESPEPPEYLYKVSPAPAAAPPWMADAPPAVDTSAEAEAHRGRFYLIAACEYRGPRIVGCGCGSSARVCLAGRGREPGKALPADCLECVGDRSSPGGPILD